MLLLVGLGIHGYTGLSTKTLHSLLSFENIYFEKYTSPVPESEIVGLKRMLNKDVKVVPRWFIEDGRKILEQSRSSDVALIVYGDPLMATTHMDLRLRAEKSGIKTSVLHSSSSITSVMGECGLHIYKIGRIITMTSEIQSISNIYYTVYTNLLSGSHTLLLMEFNQEKHLFLKPNDALKMLLEAEAEQKHEVFSDDTFAIVASRIGSEDQSIVSGKFKSLLGLDFGEPPHSLVVTASLHFTETDALAVFTRLLDEPVDNSKNITKIAEQMITKYVPKARRALEHAKKLVDADTSYGDIFENAEYYILDAERFLEQGKPELAVLSIGYAEGLIDAIRLLKGVDVWD